MAIIVVTMSLTLIVLGFAGNNSDGFERYYTDKRLSKDSAEVYELMKIHTGGDLYVQMVDNGDCHFWAKASDKLFEERFKSCRLKYGLGLVVLGDSHAMNIYNAIAKAKVSDFIVGLSQGGCRPSNAYEFCHYDSFEKFLGRNQSGIERVIFHQSGSYLMKDTDGNVASKKVFDYKEPYYIDGEGVVKIIDYMNKLSLSVPVTWMGPFVEARVNFNKPNLWKRGLVIDGEIFRRFSDLESEIEVQLGNRALKFNYISLFNVLNIDRNFIKVDHCITYRDADHFSKCGEDLLASRFAAAFDAGKLF